MNELFMIRHGETDFNKENRFTGCSPIPLNKAGRKQVRRMRKIVSHLKFDNIYSSDIPRCRETAKLLGLHPLYTEKLQERHFGVIEGLTFDEVKISFPEEAEKMLKEDWKLHKPPGGENVEEVFNRLTGFVEEITALKKHQRILLITHAGCIRLLLSHFLYQNIDGFWRFHIENASLIHLKFSGNYAYLTL